MLERHFRRFEEALKQHGIRPRNTWNIDEKGFILGQVYKAKVICQCDQEAPIQQVKGSRESVTVLKTVLAEELTISPCIMWKGKHQLVGRYILGIGEGSTRFACSFNGWTSHEPAFEWLKNHFELQTRPQYIFIEVLIASKAETHIGTNRNDVCLF